MRWWHDVIAGSSTPISQIQNLFSQNQHKIVSAGKQIVMVGRPEVVSQSLPSCCLPEICKCIRAEL